MTQVSERAWRGRVHRVQHTLGGGGRRWTMVVSDLLLTEHGPVLVLEWEDRPDGAYPVVTVQIDPAALHAGAFGLADHLYEHPIEDPRPLH